MLTDNVDETLTHPIVEDTDTSDVCGDVWDLGVRDEEESGNSEDLFPVEKKEPSVLGGGEKNFKNLEEEHEMLATSLMALTSHFAQVQFRLRQVVQAPSIDRDKLLKNLEEFAFRGIPEVQGHATASDSDDVITNLEQARVRQCELINLLKTQLSELEKVAYDSGAPILPQSVLVEKQKVIIDELKNKLNLNVNDFELPELSSEELRSQVDNAIGEFVGPFKMKEQLVTQLKTQISDLERFIAFLQCDSEETRLRAIVDGNEKKNNSAYNTYSAKKKNSSHNQKTSETNGSTVLKGAKYQKQTKPEHKQTYSECRSLTSKAHGLIDRASTLLQMFAASQIGCRSNRMEKNSLKKTFKVNHWGDVRAQLEIDIQKVVNLAKSLKREKEKLNKKNTYTSDKDFIDICSEYTSDSDDIANCSSGNAKASNYSSPSNVQVINTEITTVVRRNFAVTLQKLIQHGLYDDQETYNSLVPFVGCFNTSTSRSNVNGLVYPENDDYVLNKMNKRQMHAWELILEYYHIKNGDKFNETPARKLSQSFNLNIVGGQTVSNNQNLLSTVGSIIAMHGPYRRSHNSHFKAFVCAALNARKLVVWLNLIFQCTELTSTYYTNWSYAAKTGFRDSLRSLDCLSKYEFDLPVDLAIRQFRNINDVFM